MPQAKVFGIREHIDGCRDALSDALNEAISVGLMLEERPLGEVLMDDCVLHQPRAVTPQVRPELGMLVEDAVHACFS